MFQNKIAGVCATAEVLSEPRADASVNGFDNEAEIFHDVKIFFSCTHTILLGFWGIPRRAWQKIDVRGGRENIVWAVVDEKGNVVGQDFAMFAGMTFG